MRPIRFPMSPAPFRASVIPSRKALHFRASAATLATILFTATMAHAVNRTWSAAASGDFNDGANWNPAFEGIGAWTADIVMINSGLDNFPTLSTGTASLTEIQVGNLGTSVGKLAITGGSITLSDNITIGRQGTAQGTVEISGGGSLAARQFRVGGGSATAVGTATVSGAGSTLNTGSGTAQAVVNIGAMGTGTLTLENSAVWNASISNPAVGGDNNAPGVTGTGLGGNGTLNIRSGATFNANNVNVAVGRNGNGVGTVNVTDGGQFNLIKGAGSPFLNLANRNANSTVPAGANYPVATINLSGATSAINVPYVLVGYGTATLNLNGGTLKTERISKDTGVATGSATIHLNGTRLKATADNFNYFSSFDSTNLTLDVAAGGLLFDTDTFNVAITQALPGVGGLTKYGNGTLTLSGESSYSGDTTVNEGSLQLFSSAVTNILPDTTALRLSTGTKLITSIDTETVDTFYIDGVPQAAGLWGPIGSSTEHESALIMGDGLLKVTRLGTVTPTSPFATWATTKGLSGNDALATADPDRDGYSNLLEFILGGEPNPANPGAGTNNLAPEVSASNGNHVFSFRRSAQSTTQSGLVSGYEYSSTLAGWAPVVHGQGGITVIPNGTGYGGGIDRIDITIPDTLANGGKIFVRLAAKQN
ncbi:MAG: hypothetical protein EOP88_12270 [Verrucomicrobiaceae bacterium]|nr:MAG: hypothetical protein EOP88_12270 [Verrucomicrobiaceae bacterium]